MTRNRLFPYQPQLVQSSNCCEQRQHTKQLLDAPSAQVRIANLPNLPSNIALSTNDMPAQRLSRKADTSAVTQEPMPELWNALYARVSAMTRSLLQKD